MKQRLESLIVRYGKVAVGVYFAIFALVLFGFAAAIAAGVQVESVAAGQLTVWGGAYLATKLTQPLRIAATLLLTPLVARLWRRNTPAAKP